MASNKHAHLEMIEGVINRLSHNSFLLKGWSVILVSALFALSAEDSTAFFSVIAYFPALAFWGLDGYFLRQEKLYRELFKQVAQFTEEKINFSMDTDGLDSEVKSWSKVIISTTLLVFHGAITCSITAVTIYTLCGGA